MVTLYVLSGHFVSLKDLKEIDNNKKLKYWSKVWIHYYFIFFYISHLCSSSLHLFDQNVYILLKYTLCDADLLEMLETCHIFSGLFDE